MTNGIGNHEHVDNPESTTEERRMMRSQKNADAELKSEVSPVKIESYLTNQETN